MADDEMLGRNSRGGGARPQLRKPRRDLVMTAAVRRDFLAELARTCNIAASARAVGVPEDRARQLARNNAEFGAGVRAALAEGYATLEFAMLELTLQAVGVRADGEKLPAVMATPIDMKTALALLNAHRDTVTKERARVAAMGGGAKPAKGEAVKRLVAKLDAIAARMGHGKADGE